MERAAKKYKTRSNIVNYIINNKTTSKVEISKELNLSMPTVLSNVNGLIEEGIVVENGEYESTGGRKAKGMSINPVYRYAVGLMITANHLVIALVNMRYEVEKEERIRMKFSPESSYCMNVAELVEKFINGMDIKDRILGVGISIPGIINRERHMIEKSHALQLENYSLSFFEQAFSYPVYFENDANAAMNAENLNKYKNAVYLSLNNTLGGAFCINGKLFQGQAQKAGEFGHMILFPGGRRCYCGKEGCADAYCAASVLVDDKHETLEQFMKSIGTGDKLVDDKWDKYLTDLAILISNIRMAYDTDIILGGEVGGYLSEHMMALGEKVMSYNNFDTDIRYLKNCANKREASAVGAAKYFLYEFIKNI
ncbi:ROK family transcriptional regulator [Eubacterium sp. MSJ-13]|uniref:ROK family transcriptional regulator n=1 Tax=Eubacterium sp. MSJ-13 TaxID=2841513 RepID=UPI001C118C4B|nr:ROK family transcriptional regulator [Eubacterium sp. MSJ-13]MBU5479129.1 ROK family transcriptional regulator [Eubacterium sp. MSJ-13]